MPQASRKTLVQWLTSLFLLLLMLGASPGASLASDVTPTALATVEGVSEYQLENGLRILLAPDASKPNTTVNMTYLVGARHENYGQTGMAHLLEHMLFRGTPSLPDALGEFSRRGLQANGSTSADRTNYYASFAADADTLDWYIHWQADAMVNASISRADLDAEMTVVRNEMERGENSPFQVLMQKMQAAAFQWHNYGRSTIGARSDVENVDVDQLRAFYRQYYQPDNAVLIITGQFDVQATLASVRDAFDAIPRPQRTLPAEYTLEPVQDGERLVRLHRQGGSPLIAALYHIPAAADPDYVALDLGVDLLGDTPSGPLYHALVREQLASSVFGFAADMRQPGFAFFAAQLEPDTPVEASLEALSQTLDDSAGQPIQSEDLERVRTKWLTGWERIYADPVALASALSEATANGDWRLFFWLRDQAEKVSAEQVGQALSAYLVADNRTLGVYYPSPEPRRAPQAHTPRPDELLRGYRGREHKAQAEVFDASPANIDARTERSVMTLDNGPVSLALLPKSTRGQRVEARLLLEFGNAKLLAGRRVAAATTAALLAHGTTRMSRQEIEDRFNALQASVNIGGAGTSVTISLSTTGPNLPELVELVFHLLREARFPAEELKEYQRRQLTALTNAMAEPHALAAQALARHANRWPADDIRYVPDFKESIEEIQALSTDDLADFHERFYGAGRVMFSAVGDFDAQAVKAALAKGLDGWKWGPEFERIAYPWNPVPAERFSIATPGKANAFYLSVLKLRFRDSDPEFPALYLANYLLGSSETSRLWTRVRTREGLSYDVRSVLDLSFFDDDGNWRIHAIFAPENRERLTQAIDQELARVLQEGFSQEEVDQGVRALLNYRRLARSRDGVVAGAWLQHLQTGRSFAWSQEMDDALQALTADEVNRLLRRVLQPGLMSTAIAADPQPAAGAAR